MGIKTYNPTSPGRRFMQVSTFEEITKSEPEKNLLDTVKSSGGRNSYGRMTVRHRGGGHKRRYRKIDFKRDKLDVPAKITAIEYDPNRSARIALLCYADGEKRYIIAPSLVKVGQELISSKKGVDIIPGNAMPLRIMPLGTVIHNIEMKIGKGGQMVRSAGTSAQLLAKDGDYAQLRMPSGEMRLVHLDCMATVGQVSNPDNSNITLGKAGRSRWLGRRPHVRGVVMNPVDHPHGGGEGRAGQGNPHPVSPWGVPTKGYKTRKKNKPSDKYIIKRRSKR